MHVKWIPGREYVSFLQTVSKPDKSLAYDLYWISLDGEVKGKIEGVFVYDWSPDGRRIAYLTGKESQEDVPCITDGLWIYDVKTGSKKKICAYGNYLNWDTWDGNLYFEDQQSSGDERGMFCYDVRKGKIAKTPYKTFWFSPDGKYYLNSLDMECDTPNEIVDRATNTALTHLGKREITLELKWGIELSEWLDKDWVSCIESYYYKYSERRKNKPVWDCWNFVLNIATGELRITPERILGKIQGDKLVVAVKGNPLAFNIVPLDSLEKVDDVLLGDPENFPEELKRALRERSEAGEKGK